MMKMRNFTLVCIALSILSATQLIAQEDLELIITSPLNGEEFNSSTIILSANMTYEGNISYKLDNGNTTLICEACNSIAYTLSDLENGQHTISVIGQTENSTIINSINFTISIQELNNELEVIITQPQNLQEFNTTDVTISAEMNKQGTMSYKLNEDNLIQACELCSSFTEPLQGLEDGTYQLFVTGTAGNESTATSLFFVVNTTLPSDRNDTIPPPFNETNPPNNNTNQSDDDVPKFSLGLQKLPKLLENGEISNEELTIIINSNKLNPGVINRLAKTGLLTEENKNAIVNTQFLPKGILDKILGLIGFAKNTNLEEFIENTNLNDEQLATLIEKNEIPEMTAKKIINTKELSENSIDALTKKSDEKMIIEITTKQTLTSKNIKTILKQNPSKDIIKAITANQVLEEESIDNIIQIQPISEDLNKYQKLNEKQKKDLGIDELSKVVKGQDTIKEEPITIGTKRIPEEQKENAKENKNINKDRSKENTNSESSKKSDSKGDSVANKGDNKGNSEKTGSDNPGNSASNNPGKSNNGNSGNNKKSENNPGKGKP